MILAAGAEGHHGPLLPAVAMVVVVVVVVVSLPPVETVR